MLETIISQPSPSIATQRKAATIVRIAVVIPFFQRKTGILARALQSIKDQRFSQSVWVEVLVVNDGSPLSPEGECKAAELDDHMQLRILTRLNGGPGAARNTGLDTIDAATNFVAFLDSDDFWQPDHLQHAIDALGQDCDFYFCDHQSPGSGISYFNELREEEIRYRLPHALVPTPATPGSTGAEDEPWMYLDEKAATLALVRRYLAHTSTIVFRREPMSAIRFFEKLRFAGEDYLFSLELAHAARKTCCSLVLNVCRGKGIDLYMGAVARSHPDNARLVLDNLRCFIRAKALFGTNAALREAVERRITVYRTEFIWVTLRRFLLSFRFDYKTVESAHRADSSLLLLAPALMIRATGARLIGRRLTDL